jgi:hypothetical protein
MKCPSLIAVLSISAAAASLAIAEPASNDLAAPHAFDIPLLPPSLVIAGGQTVRHCVIREELAGMLIDASTKELFTYKDTCVELNPHVGFDPIATEAAKVSVKQFLNTVFKL